MEKDVMSKTALARSLGISRASLYYVSRLEKKDWTYTLLPFQASSVKSAAQTCIGNAGMRRERRLG